MNKFIQVEFVIPVHPEDLSPENASSTAPKSSKKNRDLTVQPYEVLQSPQDYSTTGPALMAQLNALDDTLRMASPDAIVAQEHFDPLYAILSLWPSLKPGVRSLLVNILLSGSSRLVDTLRAEEAAAAAAAAAEEGGDENSASQSNQDVEVAGIRRKQRNALKMFSFLLSWLVTQAEAEVRTAAASGQKASSTSEFLWTVQDPLKALLDVVSLKLGAWWDFGVPEEDFLALASRAVFQTLEHPPNAKAAAVRGPCLSILAKLVNKFNAAMSITTTMLHMLPHHEHLAVTFADVAASMASEEHGAGFVVDALLAEIGAFAPDEYSRDPSGAKHISLFVAELADRLPGLGLRNLSHLTPQLDSDSYMLRNAVIHVVGAAVADGFPDVDFATDQAASAARDELIALLQERWCDENGYVRGKVLRVWAYLVERGAVPLKLIQELMSLAKGRLTDKTAFVRKYAVQLTTALVRFNKFSPVLSMTAFKAQVQALSPPSSNDEDNDKDKDNQGQDEEEAPPKELTEEETKQALMKQFLDAGTAFIQSLHDGLPVYTQLLASKTASDVLETVRLIEELHAFQVDIAPAAIRSMLMLMWARDAAIKDTAAAAFGRLYLNPKSPDVKGLIKLTVSASLAELTSLEEFLSGLVRKGTLPDNIVAESWTVFTSADAPAELRAGALSLITMIAGESPSVLMSRKKALLSTPFTSLGDEALVQGVSSALARLNGTGEVESRLPNSDPLFSWLGQAVLDHHGALSEATWYATAANALKAVFTTAAVPETIVSTWLDEFSRAVRTPQGDVPAATTLAHAVFLAGETAVKFLVYTEETHRQIKRRRAKAEAALEAAKAAAADAALEADLKGSKKRAGTKKSSEADAAVDALEKELGMTGSAQAEDAETEFLMKLMEDGLVAGPESPGVLSTWTALIIHIASHPDQFPAPTLRLTAVMALAKYMTVSTEFCEAHLPLLFTLLAKEADATVRANLVLSLGDLAFRFPNSVEPWTPHLYAALEDKSANVRKHTLMVLTHLILNDMIKARGNISKMAQCLADPETRIADLARLFFFELSRKGNTLFNVMPDIISPLADSTRSPLTEASFQSTMKYLFSFISRDKDTVALVDKLCNRFATSDDVVFHRNIAFCLAQLTYTTDRPVAQLTKWIKRNAAVARGEGVAQHFIALCNKSRKFAKPELRTAIDEFETLVNAATKVEGEDEDGEDGSQEAQIVSDGSTNVPPPLPSADSIGKPNPFDFSASVENEKENAATPNMAAGLVAPPTRRSARSRRS